mgnify:CR=1 FL=1
MCIAGAAIGIMQFIEHRHRFNPSSLLAAYLILTILFDITKSRTNFVRTGLVGIGASCAASCGLKALLIALGEVSKRSLIRDQNVRKTANDETVAGFWNRALFLWLNGMLKTGYKRILRMDDLPTLDPQLHSKALFERARACWKRGKISCSVTQEN